MNHSDHDSLLEKYSAHFGRSFTNLSLKKLAGMTAAAATGLYSASQADADIIFVEGPGQLEFNTVTFSVSPYSASRVSRVASLNISLPTGGLLVKADSYFYTDSPPPFEQVVYAWGNPSSTNARVAKSGPSGRFDIQFSRGQTIGPSLVFSQTNLAGGLLAGGVGLGPYDPWGAMAAGSDGPVQGFVGFAFGDFSTGDLKFGWLEIELKYTDSGTIESLAVLGWAYDDSGSAIVAGAVPEPTAAGLAMLATGAAGLRRRRKEKSSD